MSYQHRNVYWAWLSVLVVVLDQISKQLVVRNLNWFEIEPLLPHLNLVHMKNTGAAFSMFTSASPIVFVLLGSAVSLGILWWLRTHPRGQMLVAIALSLIMGGALGNVIDRVTRGHVVDFIDFYVGTWHFAAFNLADSAISCGAVLLLLDMWRDARARKLGGAVVMQVRLANPRGFCAGVDRAIEIVERALEVLGAPIYVRHEVVHNRFVVENLRAKGAVFVEEVDEVPAGATCIFSAHGVSQAVREAARSRGLTVFDATCPLVTKVHIEVKRYSREGRDVVLIGHAGHPEVEGTMGQFDASFGGAIHLVETPADVDKLTLSKPEHLAYVTQTTLSVDDTARVIDALRMRFPKVHGPRKDDICYATQNRQDAVKDLAAVSDIVLVVGSRNSSNSNRLRELSESCGTPAYLIDGAQDIRDEWLANQPRIGVTAGASAPEVLVREVVARLRELGAALTEELPGREETIVFSLPPALRRASDTPTPQQ